MIASTAKPAVATKKTIRSVLRTLDDASTAAAVAPGFGVKVTAGWPGSLTTTRSLKDDCTCARSCWSIAFTSTPRAVNFATSS